MLLRYYYEYNNQLYECIKIQLFLFKCFDVLATTAAFVGTTVRQVSLWVSSHRYVAVGRTTPRLGSSTCLVLSWCVSLPCPFCCFLCRSPWCGSSLWRGWKRWRGLWLLEKYTIIPRPPLLLEVRNRDIILLLLLLLKNKIKVTLSHQRRCRGTEQV